MFMALPFYFLSVCFLYHAPRLVVLAYFRQILHTFFFCSGSHLAHLICTLCGSGVFQYLIVLRSNECNPLGYTCLGVCGAAPLGRPPSQSGFSTHLICVLCGSRGSLNVSVCCVSDNCNPFGCTHLGLRGVAPSSHPPSHPGPWCIQQNDMV